MSGIKMKIKYIKLWSFLTILILCYSFFRVGLTYNNIKSSYFQLKLIDSFERSGDWGDDGARFKGFSRSINLNVINNSKSGFISRYYVYIIEKINPSYPRLFDKMKNDDNNYKSAQNIDLRKKIQDGLGPAVDVEFSIK